MRRTRAILINVVSWVVGLGIVFVAAEISQRVLSEGFVRTAVMWIVVGVAVTFLAGGPLALSRRVIHKTQPTESRDGDVTGDGAPRRPSA